MSTGPIGLRSSSWRAAGRRARPCRRPRASARAAQRIRWDAVAVVPVVGEEVGVVRARPRPGWRPPRSPRRGRARWAARRTARSCRVQSFSGRQPAAGQPAVVARLADRHPPGGLVADVALGVGVDEVLRRRGEAATAVAEGRPSHWPGRAPGSRRRCAIGSSAVHDSETAYSPSPSPAVVARGDAGRRRRARRRRRRAIGPWPVERTVSVDVVAAGDLDGLGAGAQRPQLRRRAASGRRRRARRRGR